MRTKPWWTVLGTQTHAHSKGIFKALKRNYKDFSVVLMIIILLLVVIDAGVYIIQNTMVVGQWHT